MENNTVFVTGMSCNKIIETDENTFRVHSDTEEPVEVVEPEVTTTINTDDVETTLSMGDIETLTKYIHSQGVKESLNNEFEKVEGARQELLGSITGLDNEKDFIQDKLDKFSTVEELQEHLKSDKNVEEFYVNDDTGEVFELAVNIEDPKRAMQFKRELLVYLKTTDIAHAAIDKEYDELEKATAEMDMNLKEACVQLSDNVLTYTGYLKDNAEKCEDETLKKNIKESAKYIESGYTFEVLQEVLDEHPSVIRNTVKELVTSVGIDRTGKRYTDKLKRYGIKVSLIPLVPNSDSDKSIEEMVLIKDDEYKLPNLFIYSAIRYFAMANWDNENTKRFHASLALVMKRLMSNSLHEDVKEMVLTNMIKYLAQFDKYII